MKKILLLCLLIPQVTFAMIGLKVGDLVPDINIKDTEGTTFNFSKQSKTTIAVF